MQAFLPAETGLSFAYYRHESLLTKLTPGTYYRYRVFMDGQPVATSVLSFRTPGTRPFEFLAFGDSGTGSAAQGSIARQMLQQDADFIIHTGDLVYPTGTYERYESLYFEFYRDLMRNAPFFPCPGNHDYYETSCIPYRAIHSLPDESVAGNDYGRYYSFDWGNAHFISLDSNQALQEASDGYGAMLTWLENDLKQTTKFWRIVFVHHPAYAASVRRSEVEAERLRAYVAPILDRYSVPLVLNGHEHSYQRSAAMTAGQIGTRGEGTVYVTTGGGGAQLYPVPPAGFLESSASEHHFVSCNVNGAKLQLKAIRSDGSELDSALIAPKPVLDSRGVVNAASFTPQLASGGLVSIFGYQLSPEEVTALQYPLPTSAGGTSVLLGSRPLPILMASATQMNVQLPFDARGHGTLSVRTPNGIASSPVSIAPVAPALFLDAIFHSDGTQVSSELPAAPGESVSVYLTGLGAVIGDAVAGEPAMPLPAAVAVEIRLDNLIIEPEFAGLAEGLAGVNVVRFRMPGLRRRQVSLTVVAGGAESNAIPVPTSVVIEEPQEEPVSAAERRR